MMSHADMLLDCAVIDIDEWQFLNAVAEFEALLCQHYDDERNPYPPVANIGGEIVCR